MKEGGGEEITAEDYGSLGVNRKQKESPGFSCLYQL